MKNALLHCSSRFLCILTEGNERLPYCMYINISGAGVTKNIWCNNLFLANGVLQLCCLLVPKSF